MKESILVQLGSRVRELRKINNLTQEQLAVKANISLKYIQSIEGKKPRNPSLESLQKLSKGFGMPIWKLLKFKE